MFKDLCMQHQISRLREIEVCTAPTLSADRAMKVTGKPALANTSTMPVAIVPEPTTPTEVIARV